MAKDSRIPKFYEKPVAERLGIVSEFAGLTDDDIAVLKKPGSLGIETANRMIENVISTHELPLGIATNFVINGKPYLVPMVLEEPSVVAAASNAAKLAGSFEASSDEPVMIGQVLLVDVKKMPDAKKKILAAKKRLLEMANARDSVLVKFGGGAKGIEVKEVKFKSKKMLIVHLLVDVRDAMGANAVNTMCETIAPELESLSGGIARMRIISNLAVYRKARAKAVWKKEIIGKETVDAVLDAYAFAAADVFRCATHNKGIMNGIDAVVLATGNDFRAVEAGAHAFAAYGKGGYKPLTKYYSNKNGDLVGEIELPMAVGLVGGATKTHPTAKIAVKILGVKTAKELSEVIAAVGLAQNFAAMRALSTEGIQRGHMKLHSKNIAVQAGASGNYIERVAGQMVKEGNISVSRAKEIMEGKK